MRIVSWNVNGLMATLESGSFAPLEEMRPDALCLQETRTDAEPEVLAGYRHFYNHGNRSGYAGTALATRSEPEYARAGFARGGDAEGRVVCARLGGLSLVNVYVPRSAGDLRRRQFRVDFDDALLLLVEGLLGDGPVVVCGDMNAPLEIGDVFEGNPHRGEEAQGWASDERDLLLSLLDLGLADAFRLCHPDAGDAFTWWSQRRARRKVNRGWRLDYFFVSGDVAGRVRACEHLTDVSGSDHCPILLDLAL